MLERVEITSETEVRVLAFRGLKNEYYQGVPEAWIECFGVKDEMDPESPTFDQILYLRNVNIYPTASEVMETFFPIWHAAVITFKDGKPVIMLMISETELMDKLIKAHHPDKIVQRIFPHAKTDEIRVDLIDAEEEAQKNKSNHEFPCIVFEGWPAEEAKANYLRMKQNVETVAKATGKTSELGFTYTLKTEKIDIQLHFVYLIMDVVHEELLWIQRDEMKPVPNPDNDGINVF